MPQAKLSDPSGRGKAEGFKVIFPMMQHPYTEAEIQAVVDVMRNAEGQTQGKYLEKFEKDFAAFVGAKYAFGVNNCTNALKLAAIFCHIQPGDEVIVPAYTYCASAIPFGDLAHISSGQTSIRIPGPSTPMISSVRSRPRPRLWWPFTCWASPAT